MTRASRPQGRPQGLRPSLIAVSVAACFALSPAALRANPTGPTAVTGVAGISGLGTAAVTVTTTGNAIVNWQSFSIGVNEITRILQPSAANAILNRVAATGGQSLIDGLLQSNGRVFLLNPNGIVFGASARIDVAGLVASSLNLSDADFLAGRLRFDAVPGAGGVANHGVINTPAGGRVFLVAPSVENTGIIRAPQGEVVLAAGRTAELVSESSPFVTVRVEASAEQALNVGSLIADSGRIGMYGALVRNSGVAEAGGAVMGPGGQIRFVATKDVTLDAGSRTAASGLTGGDILIQAKGGTNRISGTVEAIGSQGAGGSVKALGVRVGVVGHGVIDASGETGGGTVLVGGDYLGGNAEVQNAERTLVGANGVIRADAKGVGDGGKVIVWADGDTRMHGTISARGGEQGGNGGFVETSGKIGLDVTGARVDTRAPQGVWGTWLLDPADVTIVANDFVGMTELASSVDDFTDSHVYGGNVTRGTLEAAFGSTGSVIIQSQNNVTLTTDLSLVDAASYGGGTGLNIRAGNNINLGTNTITMSSATPGAPGRDIHLTANDPSYASGTGSITGLGNLITNGGHVGLSGYAVAIGSINTTHSLATAPSDTSVTINATGGGVFAGNITTGNATLSSYVNINSQFASITVGNVSTGAASDNFGDSHIALGTTGVGNITTGALTTGATGSGGDAYSGIGVNAQSGTVSTGTIVAGSGDAAYVSISGYYGVATGSIGTGNATYGTDVTLQSTAGGITAAGITTGNSSQPGYHSKVTVNAPGAIAVGAIATGTANGSTYVHMSSTGSTVNVGNVTTGAATGASGDSTIILFSEGNLSAGNLTTGSATSWSYVDVSSNASIALGSIFTGPGPNANSGSSYVYIANQGSSGSVSVGNITTGSSVDSNVYIDSLGTVQAGNIVTGNAGNDSDVRIDALGSVTVGSISTGTANIFSGESNVDIESGGAVTTGSITTGSSEDTGVYIYATGNISTGPIATGSAGYWSGVELYSSGGSVQTAGITTGPVSDSYGTSYISIHAGGGGINAGNLRTGDGGEGAAISLSATGNIVAGNVTAAPSLSYYYGGNGISFQSSGGSIQTGDVLGFGVSGGGIFYSAAGSVSTGALTYVGLSSGSTGIVALAGGGIQTGRILSQNDAGYQAGAVQLMAYGGSIVVNGGIVTRGSNGSASSPYGASGANVVLNAAVGSVQVNGSIDTSGGSGATSSGGSGGSGGYGGHVTLSAGPSVGVAGTIVTRGGNGGNSTSSYYGGWGGWGGNLTLIARDKIEVGPPARFGQIAKVIDTSGGAGGTSATGKGGGGGAAGYVFVDPAAIQINGVVQATGGAGGAGALGGGNGGAGGALDLFTTGGTGTITFVNGGWDLSGGPGGSPGGLAGANGVPTTEGTLIFLTLNDVLSSPAVVQQVVNVIKDTLKASKGDEDEGGRDEEEERNKKKGFGACKP